MRCGLSVRSIRYGLIDFIQKSELFRDRVDDWLRYSFKRQAEGGGEGPNIVIANQLNMSIGYDEALQLCFLLRQLHLRYRLPVVVSSLNEQ